MHSIHAVLTGRMQVKLQWIELLLLSVMQIEDECSFEVSSKEGGFVLWQFEPSPISFKVFVAIAIQLHHIRNSHILCEQIDRALLEAFRTNTAPVHSFVFVVETVLLLFSQYHRCLKRP